MLVGILRTGEGGRVSVCARVSHWRRVGTHKTIFASKASTSCLSVRARGDCITISVLHHPLGYLWLSHPPLLLTKAGEAEGADEDGVIECGNTGGMPAPTSARGFNPGVPVAVRYDVCSHRGNSTNNAHTRALNGYRYLDIDQVETPSTQYSD